eukprot:203180-Hanusia_phi.AAC.1
MAGRGRALRQWPRDSADRIPAIMPLCPATTVRGSCQAQVRNIHRCETQGDSEADSISVALMAGTSSGNRPLLRSFDLMEEEEEEEEEAEAEEDNLKIIAEVRETKQVQEEGDFIESESPLVLEYDISGKNLQSSALSHRNIVTGNVLQQKNEGKKIATMRSRPLAERSKDMQDDKRLSPRSGRIEHSKCSQVTPEGLREFHETAESLYKRIPDNIESALMPFQKEGVKFGISHEGKVLIADEMGLGKTLQAIAIACVFSDDWPVVCLMPASMRWVWAEELEKWLTNLRPGDIKVVRSSTDVDNLRVAKMVIVTYDLLSRSEFMQSSLLSCGFRTIIVDESHYCKNKDTKRTMAVLKLAKQARRRILLSGTPALNRPAELFSQISMIADKLFGTWTDYTTRYCDGRRGRFGWECKGATNIEELHDKVSEAM